ATTTVDGERLQSQQFTVPTSGGIRVALVATDPAASKGAGGGGAPPPQAATGSVSLGDQSRFVVEMGADEALNVFYILEVVNSAQSPVQPPAPLVFDLPADARGAGTLEGSGGQVTVSGTRVSVQGPLAPALTLAHVESSIP